MRFEKMLPWFLIFALVALAASLFRARRDRRHLDGLRREARNAIASVRVESSDARYALNGESAVLEYIEEIGGVRGLLDKRADLSVTAHVRNAAGERFIIKWHSRSHRQPYVRHLQT